MMAEILHWQTRLEEFVGQNQGADGAHDLGHVRRVWRIAQQIADADDDQLVILAACYFHDLVNYPKNHPRRSQSSRDSAAKARSLLPELGFPDEKINQVCHCIEAHSFSAGIEPISNEAKVVQDADRLDALGAVGLARTFYVAGQMGTGLFCEDDPFAINRPVDDHRFALDHFKAKLLRLPSLMMTSAGRKMAKERVKLIEDFLKQLQMEL